MQDKTLSDGKVPGTGSSAKRPYAKIPPSTLVSSASRGDPKEKHLAEPFSSPAKWEKGSAGLLAPPAPKSSTRAGTPWPIDIKFKREKLSCPIPTTGRR
ncbi:UNVERIFIED_CONTAM: hypothetical protein Slati_4474800 [Sesamum latifolium]|uniref:Uncharacterized protein n=1 Tax=Sesamum latifolium TaxID=2727402 RepID=A0AAW2SU78_9LAMI